MSNGFDEAMLSRLRASDSEASKLVLHLAEEMILADAILAAIESLTTRQTIQLRRWVENWEAFREWLSLRREGWDIQRHHHFMYVHSPKGDSAFNEDYRTSDRDDALWPHADVVAAAADVQEVRAAELDPRYSMKPVNWDSTDRRWSRRYYIT